MDDFLKLLRKKSDEQGGPMKGPKMAAKAAMAKELSDLLGSDLADEVKGVKKVTVASDSEEGLEEGLEKAQEVLKSKSMKDESDEMEDESEEMEDESEEESEEDESEESEEMADVEDEIAKLEKQIAQLKKKKK